jgi:phosphopantothenoylcysteine decarboxylase
MNIVLGLTGSVAAIKAAKLVEALEKVGDVKIVATSPAFYFMKQDPEHRKDIDPGYSPHTPRLRGIRILRDHDEFPPMYELGDEILHIELRKWASCLVVAPLSANTLAKFSHGLCDNLLTSLFRAWDFQRPVVVAPAMNTMMWHNPHTERQLAILEDMGVSVVDPVKKELACGDVGLGAMAPAEDIAETVTAQLRWQFPLRRCNGIPINHHPGAFGFHRKKNHHTGVDLYCKDGEQVFAVEDGVVVKYDVFTGPSVGHDWWEETHGLMVEGASGVINYGEIASNLKEGSLIRRGQEVGNVKRVLFKDRQRPDIPGHSTSMLHFELYRHGTRDYADWHDPEKNPDLLDPTPYLMQAVDAPQNTLTWGNEEGKTVG